MNLLHENKIQAIFSKNTHRDKKDNYPEFLSEEELQKVKAYHETIKAYNITPLVELKKFSKRAWSKEYFC